MVYFVLRLVTTGIMHVIVWTPNVEFQIFTPISRRATRCQIWTATRWYRFWQELVYSTVWYVQVRLLLHVGGSVIHVKASVALCWINAAVNDMREFFESSFSQNCWQRRPSWNLRNWAYRESLQSRLCGANPVNLFKDAIKMAEQTPLHVFSYANCSMTPEDLSKRPEISFATIFPAVGAICAVITVSILPLLGMTFWT